MKEYVELDVKEEVITDTEMFYMVLAPNENGQGFSVMDIVSETMKENVIAANYDAIDANLKVSDEIKKEIRKEVQITSHLYIPVPGAVAVTYKALLKDVEKEDNAESTLTAANNPTYTNPNE